MKLTSTNVINRYAAVLFWYPNLGTPSTARVCQTFLDIKIWVSVRSHQQKHIANPNCRSSIEPINLLNSPKYYACT
jgi:hypothetical protein